MIKTLPTDKSFLVLFFVTAQEGRREKDRRSTSFLKKRSKKLSSIGAATAFELAVSARFLMDKSFLVLFFKKERLEKLQIARGDRVSKNVYPFR